MKDWGHRPASPTPPAPGAGAAAFKTMISQDSGATFTLVNSGGIKGPLEAVGGA